MVQIVPQADHNLGCRAGAEALKQLRTLFQDPLLPFPLAVGSLHGGRMLGIRQDLMGQNPVHILCVDRIIVFSAACATGAALHRNTVKEYNGFPQPQQL